MEQASPFWRSLTGPKPSGLPKIAFTDVTDERVLRAVESLKKDQICIPVMMGKSIEIQSVIKKETLDFAKSKLSFDLNSQDSLIQGALHVLDGLVDGVVAGSLRPTADVVKVALKLIGPKTGTHLVSGHFWMESADRTTADQGPFLMADCAVVPEPSAHALAATAVEAGRAYRFFMKQEPHVAMLSFSTRGSAHHPLVDRIKEAVDHAKKMDPSLDVDGELQADAALDKAVAGIKGASDSSVCGRANVLIFPTLEAGNIAYKLIQRFSKCRIAGPLLWGLKKPFSDLSRGCTTEEVVDTAAMVAAMASH